MVCEPVGDAHAAPGAFSLPCAEPVPAIEASHAYVRIDVPLGSKGLTHCIVDENTSGRPDCFPGIFGVTGDTVLLWHRPVFDQGHVRAMAWR